MPNESETGRSGSQNQEAGKQAALTPAAVQQLMAVPQAAATTTAVIISAEQADVSALVKHLVRGWLHRAASNAVGEAAHAAGTSQVGAMDHTMAAEETRSPTEMAAAPLEGAARTAQPVKVEAAQVDATAQSAQSQAAPKLAIGATHDKKKLMNSQHCHRRIDIAAEQADVPALVARFVRGAIHSAAASAIGEASHAAVTLEAGSMDSGAAEETKTHTPSKMAKLQAEFSSLGRGTAPRGKPAWSRAAQGSALAVNKGAKRAAASLAESAVAALAAEREAAAEAARKAAAEKAAAAEAARSAAAARVAAMRTTSEMHDEAACEAQRVEKAAAAAAKKAKVKEAAAKKKQEEARTKHTL